MKKGKMTAPLFDCAYLKCPKQTFFEVHLEYITRYYHSYIQRLWKPLNDAI